MTTRAEGRYATPSPRAARLLFGGALALALLVLVLWAAGRWEIGTLGQHDVPMAPSTAVLMSLLALAGSRPTARRQSLATGLLLIVVGTFSLSWNVSGLESTLVRILTVGPVTRDAVPVGVMSPITATAFVLAGIGVAMRDARHRMLVQVGAVCATLVIILASSIAAGYLLGVPLLYGASVPMAAVTSLAFLGSGFGLVLTSGSDTWPMSIVSDRSSVSEPASAARGLVLLFLVVTAAVVLGATLYLVNSRREARREAIQILTAALSLKQEQVARWFSERRGDALVVKGASIGSDEVAIFLDERDGRTDAVAIRDWTASLREASGYRAVVLYDRSGRVRLISGDPVAPVSPAAITQALATGEVVFDDLEKDDASGARQMSFLAPIGARNGNPLVFTGVMALVVDARQQFYPLVDQWPLRSSTGDVVVTRQDGGDAVYLLERQQVDGSARTLLRLPLHTPGLAVAQVLQGRSTGAIDGIDYRGHRIVAIGGPIAGTRWSLVVKQDAEEIDAPFRRDARRTSVVSLLLLLTTAFGLTIVSRRQTLRSMSARLVVQREREESDARLRSAMAAALDAFIILDDRGRIVEWNRQAEVTFRWTGHDPAGRLFIETAVRPDGPPGYGAAIEAGRQGRSHPLLGARRTTRAVRMTGEEFPAEVTLAPIRWRDQTSFSAVVRDITDRVAADVALQEAHADTERLLGEADRARRALLNIVDDQRRTEAALRDSEALLEIRVLERTRQLEAANRELEAFSYSVSHDLRAPLRAIDGYARMLIEDHAAQFDAEGRRRLEVVQREARRMGVLIDDLLRFSRVGRQTLSMETVDMDRMVREVFAELRAANSDRMVELTIGELPPAVADPGVIRQVWVNLLGNALKFTGTRPEARIEVGGRTEKDATIYFVRDNGVGFDMKYGDKLFGVFQRLHASADFEGTGVGLALSQRIVSRHGGRIWAEGAVDRGATFSFSLPVDATPAA